jgi:hypothetical protein
LVILRKGGSDPASRGRGRKRNLVERGAGGEAVEPRRPVEEGGEREVGVVVVPLRRRRRRRRVEARLRLHLVADLLHLHHFDRTGRGLCLAEAGSERERRSAAKPYRVAGSRGNRGSDSERESARASELVTCPPRCGRVVWWWWTR